MARSYTHIYTCDRHGRIPLCILLVGGTKRGKHTLYPFYRVAIDSTYRQVSAISLVFPARGGRTAEKAGKQASERKGKEWEGGATRWDRM